MQVTRGKYTLQYRTTYKSTGKIKELDFLKDSIIKYGFPEPAVQTSETGITQDKKDDIIKKLCPLMPIPKRAFWEAFPVTASAETPAKKGEAAKPKVRRQKRKIHNAFQEFYDNYLILQNIK